MYVFACNYTTPKTNLKAHTEPLLRVSRVHPVTFTTTPSVLEIFV